MLGVRRAIVICAVVLAAAGCGSSSTGTGSSAGGSATTSVKQRAGAVLDRWSNRLLRALLTLRARSQAVQRGDTAKAAALDRKAAREIRPIEEWGRDARETFIDDPRTPVVKTTIATGDAWTRWAYTIRTQPPAGDFGKAQKIADLSASAIALERRAYRLAGRPISAAFRTR
jgi:hypothetical protein